MQPEINYKTFEIARVSRGYSQKEFAERLNVEQGTVSKIERNILGVKEDLLERISAVLNYPISFFYEDIILLSPLLTHYRKRKSLATNVLDTIEYNLFIRKHFFKKLLKSVDIPNRILHLNTYDNGTPEDIARLVRQKWNIPRGPINNLTRVVETAGIIVLQIEYNDNKLDGELLPDEDYLPVIYLNKNLSGDRQRFTLAHELGHLIMHYAKDFIPSMTDNFEEEANRFASEFLMPENDIKASFYGGVSFPQLADLKRYWKVSMAALIRRGKDLGMINESRYKSLMIQLSRAGYRKSEPEFDVKKETPTLIYQLIKVHLDELGFTSEELATLLCVTQSELNSLIDFYSNSPLKVVHNTHSKHSLK
ncbi:MAG: hypothetical protein K0Q95_2152 [Bacteroidota bacterium]|jgi:Zn-dependent peptidase ImmA (M78 family)/transcriptional regulator with XRE-family HTH domain|nr:hypothetical protein [Bacteroidota bacterium]